MLLITEKHVRVMKLRVMKTRVMKVKLLKSLMQFEKIILEGFPN